LQRIADVLEVDLSTLLTSTNIFNVSFNAAVNQSGYNINNHNISTLDIEVLRELIREELKKI